MADYPRVTLALAVISVLAGFAGEPVATALAWDRAAILHGEAWRLWSGHLVHFSPSHAGADVLALLAAGWLAESFLPVRRLLPILVGGAACISLALLVCAPALAEYRGASGLGMLLAGMAGALAWCQCPGARRLLACAAVALLAKIAWEAGIPDATLAGLPAGVAVAWQAHLLGVVAGLCAGMWRSGFGAAYRHLFRPFPVRPRMRGYDA